MKESFKINEELINKFSKALNNCFPEFCEIKKTAVAVSGGSDSMALTFLLSKLCKLQQIKLTALIVNHRFRQNSGVEAKEVAQILKNHKIEAKILHVKKSQLPKSNIEASLRELRYELLVDYCLKNQIPAVFLGHHLNDVAENFLIRLFRGSHLQGLSTIANLQKINGISFVRPLLDFSKQELREFLVNQQIQWQEDESNCDEVFLRNKIRRFLDEFDQRDLIAKRIKSASDAISQSRDLLDEISKDWKKKILQKFPQKFSDSQNLLRNSLRSRFGELDMQHFQKPLTQVYKDTHRSSLKFENAAEMAMKTRDSKHFLSQENSEAIAIQKIFHNLNQNFDKKRSNPISVLKLKLKPKSKTEQTSAKTEEKSAALGKILENGFLINCLELKSCPKQLALNILSEALKNLSKNSDFFCSKNLVPRFKKLENLYRFLTDENSHQIQHLQNHNLPKTHKISNCQAILFKNFCGLFNS